MFDWKFRLSCNIQNFVFSNKFNNKYFLKNVLKKKKIVLNKQLKYELIYITEKKKREKIHIVI